MELQDIRREIDAIDGEIARLFLRRMQAVAAVAEQADVSDFVQSVGHKLFLSFM